MDMNGILPGSGKRLKEVAKLLRFKAPACAEAMKLSRQAVNRWFRGGTEVDEARLLMLIEKHPEFKQHKDYILHGDPIKKDVAPPRPPGAMGEKPNIDRRKAENQYLKQLREIMGFSQTEIADVMRLDQSAYSRIESGVNTLREVHKDLIEIELGVPKEYFITGDAGMIPLNNVRHHLRNKKEIVPSQSPIPVLYARPPVGQTYHEFMKEATEHESIPTLNGFANFKTIIRDEALTGLFKYGRFIYVHAQDAKGILAWGAVYLVNIGDLQFVRYIQKSPNKDCIILRADEQCRDRYEDIEVKRSEVSFMGIAVADMGFVQVGTLQAA